MPFIRGVERLRHLYITAIRFLADDLYRRGVRKLYTLDIHTCSHRIMAMSITPT